MDISAITNHLGYYVRKVGRTAARPVLLLYLVLRDPATPKKDKYIVYAAIAYVVLPINILSAKRIPILGWADEATAITAAFKRVKNNITPDVERQADAWLDRWIYKNGSYEECHL
jgi:uncharacterized membrane protein YkvA (DUF1232 family)